MTLGILLLIIIGIITEVWWIAAFLRVDNTFLSLIWAMITVINFFIIMVYMYDFIKWLIELEFWQIIVF